MTRTIKIEHDIPVPPRRRGHSPGRPVLYPVHLLEVDESFAVKVTPEHRSARVLQCTLNSRCRWVRNHLDASRQFTTRVMGDEVRVWRVA